MNHCVPDHEPEDNDLSLGAAPLRRKTAALPEDELFELLWRNGPVFQPLVGDRLQGRYLPELPAAGPALSVGPAAEEAARQLFMDEDEMASWLHYHIGEGEDGGGDLYGDLLGPSLGAGEIPADQGAGAGATQVDDRTQPPMTEKFRQTRMVASVESAVVDSNETAGAETAAPAPGRGLVVRSRRAPSGIGELYTCEQAVTSSSEASGECAARAHADERKRKAREGDDSGYQSEDVEFRSGDKRKGARRSASTRRTRASEVHNQSERRRRDRINEKMKALQELIPRCNKSDKASMLDEAIEYLKSLQLQVQMMSMGCNMGPMMFPGVQTYLPPMGMSMGMGVAMGMEMGSRGIGHSMLQYAPLLPCRPMVGPTAPSHLVPRPSMPSFHSPHTAIADQSRVQASNLQVPAPNSIGMLGPNMVQIPNGADRYHHYPGLQQFQLSSQNQAMADPGTSKGAEKSSPG